MFTYFVIKRILKGIIMFIILMFMSSAIFNTVSEKTLKAQIEENINAEVRGLVNMRTEDIDNFKIDSLKFKSFVIFLVF